jgi:hypothetical protein
MVQMLLGMALRHSLTLLGGYLMSKGGLDPASAATITGAVSSLAGLGLSALNKVKVVEKINKAADSYKGFNQ